MYRLLEMKDSIARYGYTETVRNVFKDKAPRVLEVYPAPNDTEDPMAEEDIIVALTTDFFFTCPTVAITNSNVRSNISGVSERFLYQFTQVPSFLPVIGIVNTLETKFTLFRREMFQRHGMSRHGPALSLSTIFHLYEYSGSKSFGLYDRIFCVFLKRYIVHCKSYRTLV